MPVTINGSNTPTAGGVTYGDGTQYATTAAGTSGQALLSAGSGAPTWGTPSSATNLAGGSAGKVPYQTGAGATAFTAVGTSGQVLTSAGSGAPTWTTPSAGAMTLISTQTASNVASVSWTGLSGYSTYMLVVNTTLPATTNGQLLFMDFGVGATPTYISADYTYAKVYNPGYSSATGDGSGSYSSIILVRPSAGSTSKSLSGSFTITTGIGADTGTPNAFVMGTAFQASSTAINATGGWVNLGAPLTAIRLYYNGDNIGSGKFSLYGIST